MAPINKFNSTKVTTRAKITSSENAIPQKISVFSKRKAEHSPLKSKNTKRPALNDLTNDGKTAKVKSISKQDKPLTVIKEKNVENIKENTAKVKATRNVSGIRLPPRKVISTKIVETTVTRKVTIEKKPTPKPPVRATRSSIANKSNSHNTSTTQTKLTEKGVEVKRSLRANDEKNASKIQPIQEETQLEPNITRMSLRSRESIPEENHYLPSVVLSKVDVPKPKITVTAIQEVNEESIKKEIRVTRRSSTRYSLNRKSLTTDKSLESNSLYVSALEDITNTTKKDKKSEWYELTEFDKELIHDPHQVSIYAAEIFHYLKEREANFRISGYMSRLTDITEDMRTILVDWMVEVQENFELNHETLYLAVKIVDAYLDKIDEIRRNKLQLVAVGAMFIACKYDERISPLLEDFVHVCDKAYSPQDILVMEQRLLSKLNFELSFPISYSFLRRYARCARVPMPLLTLARFILELSLTDYRSVTLSDSKQAAAALFLAFRMVKHDKWTESLVNYTGYKLDDFKDIVFIFNAILHKKFPDDVRAVKTKYSHEIFYEVAKTRLISDEELKKSIAENS